LSEEYDHFWIIFFFKVFPSGSIINTASSSSTGRRLFATAGIDAFATIISDFYLCTIMEEDTICLFPCDNNLTDRIAIMKLNTFLDGCFR
jgi:hypothetical protein